MKKFKISIIVQFFVKNEYLQSIIDGLLLLKIDDYNVIFWQDELNESKFYDQEYKNKLNVCTNTVYNNIGKFKNAEYKKNKINLNCYETCKVAIDYAFQNSEYVILMEDDVIISPNFLNFYEYFINNNIINFETGILFAAAESIFFDSRTQNPTDKHIQLATQIVDEYKLDNFYITFNFVPSSCFCTSYDVWHKIGKIRGATNGDGLLCEYMKNNSFKCALSVVPCCKDVGMLNKDGYSMRVHSGDINKIQEIKNTYLLTNKFNNVFELFPYNADKLFDMTVNLNINDNTNID